MAYVLALYFDSKSEAKISEIWQDLVCEDDICSSPMHRPHISLAMYDGNEVNIKPIKKAIKKLSKNLKSFRLELSYFGYFANQESIFLGPKVNKELLAIQARLYKKLKNHSHDLSEYSEPDIWIPHCTIVYNLSTDSFMATIQKTKSIILPISIKIEEIGFVQVLSEKAETIFSKKL
ncbi:MAG TPA: 2'-5' RNA ligase family protein [Trueperaceae bacterium]|nr:2'-5' RNA ligase family protein [Trueperaceae bacterium]